MASLGTLSVDIGAKTGKFTSALNAAQSRAVAFGKSVTASIRGIGSIGGQVGQLIGVAGIGAGVTAMVKLAAQTETLGTQFRVLTGSAQKAQAVMSQIQAFAAETPFETIEIADAAKKLVAFGSSAETVVSELRMLGDIAAGVGVPLADLSEIYGKARVQGRLFAEDINQLQGRGIPVVQGLAAAMGVSEDKIRGLVESGQIGFPQLQRALAGMVAQGGDFNGMMTQLGQTTAGRFSTLVDNFKQLGVQLGTQLLPYLNDAMQGAINLAGGLDGVGASFGSILKAASTWFTETRNYFEDIGTIAGTVIGNTNLLFQGLFEDLPNYAKAALEWVATNTQVMFQNIATGAQNMWAKMRQQSQQLGEEIAFALGLSDEVLQIPAPVMQEMQAFQGFKSPELSDATKNLAAAIDEQLAASRAMRESATAPPAAAVAPAQTVAQVLESIGADTEAKTATASGQQQTAFAAAALRGSAEAYSMIMNAMKGDRDPVVKATKEQTKELKKPLLDMVGLIKGGSPVKLLGSFSE